MTALWRGPAGAFAGAALAMALGVALVAGLIADGRAAALPVLGFVLAACGAWAAFAQGWTAARLGPANAVTMARLALVSLLLAPLVSPGLTTGASGWALFALALSCLALDGLDGALARRSGLAGPWGARFDMEVDSAFGLILAAVAWRSGAAGPWVLLLGSMRYVFLLAMLVWPWLGAPLPERLRRKVICVVQIAALALLLMPIASAWTSAAALIALGLLAGSFAADILWLARRR
ncbi:CDP-alcohol phosphatidyltransferase family protein [Salipiger sp. 1_MG-2023]|uniref:CDP-alcohol phosphatidyltransferase family protein n=1 Tax=Salipiger sp. 1_MG-2023 TaxID=3062665 RepID=UPI0026E2A9D8|nr:CDP-alcohol phosphatidyltransferase family protein [Salipiger sp. 1_MG-2023]MDO6584022.1 CDP-alcohol phosphatidyltransferase family protein [Salipiger sp. 1_MG-2023]